MMLKGAMSYTDALGPDPPTLPTLSFDDVGMRLDI